MTIKGFRMKKQTLTGVALATVLAATPFTTNAANVTKSWTCWDASAKKHGLNPLMLMAIGSVESSLREGIASRNTNGSYDLGIMQINTIHLPYFNKMGYSRHELQYNSCKNIMAAGYLLKTSIKKYGYNVNGIGGYHSNTPHRRIAYGRKVLKEYYRLSNKYYGLAKRLPQQPKYITVKSSPNRQIQRVNPTRVQYVVKQSQPIRLTQSHSHLQNRVGFTQYAQAPTYNQSGIATKRFTRKNAG